MIATAVAAFLGDRLGEELVAAFIYGSVAAGRAGPDSDIDCFVLTAGDLTEDLRAQLGAEFAELQRELGYRPDPDYPLEVFSVAQCESVLAGDTFARIVADADHGRLDPQAATSDEAEILRALLDQRLVVKHAPALDQLTDQARALQQKGTRCSGRWRA